MPLLPPQLTWTGPGAKASLRGESTSVTRGVSSGRIAPTRNLQNIKDEHADQPARKKLVTPYRTHVLPMLKPRGWKQLIFKNVFISNVFCVLL